MGRHSEAKEGYFRLMRRSNGYFYYWTYDKYGRRIYRSTGKRIRARAMEVAIERWRAGTLIDQSRPVWHSFGEYAEHFWDWETCPIIQDRIRRGGHYSKALARSYAQLTDKHITAYFKDKPIEAITPRMVSDWLVRLPDDHHISNKSCNNVLTAFRQILDAAVADGIIDRNPAKAVKPLIKDGTRRGCYTTDQVKAIFKDMWEDRHVYTMCRLAAFTGMRLGEVQALTRGQIRNGYIEVDASWAKREGRKTTKSGYGRIVPIDQRMQELLRAIMPPSDGDLLFTLDGSNPMSGNTVRKRLCARMDKLKIDHRNLGLSFHSFRHFFNTRLVAAGVDGEQIRAVVGHESEAMTEHYLHLTAEDMECIRAVQRGIAL